MKVGRSHLHDRVGVTSIGKIINDEFHWLFREQPVSDFGIDAHIEIVKNGEATGRLIAVQIKSGDSYLAKSTDTGFNISIKNTHIEYWQSYSLPVVLLVYSPAKEKVYWEVINKGTVKKSIKTSKIFIPFSNTLSVHFAEKLADHANPPLIERKYNRLKLSKPLMQLLEKDTPIFVETEDWVNKSLSRFSVRVLIENNQSLQWPMIFGPYLSVEEAVHHFMPWADLEVDDDFYYDYDFAQYQLECGHYDSEDDTWFYHEEFDEWCERNISEGIRSYECDGEVAHYRLKLSLNELGKAFLIVDQYLNETEPVRVFKKQYS
jgi:hypothetical protein